MMFCYLNFVKGIVTVLHKTLDIEICSITLIVATRDDHSDDCHLSKLLDNIFQAMVLLYGFDEVTNIKNVERFKREIKVGWWLGFFVVFFVTCFLVTAYQYKFKDIFM